MKFELPKLPYSVDALAPFISAETLEFHYQRHHRGYVEKLNELVLKTPFADASLEEVVQQADGPLFNNAAQAWNHAFYWNDFRPCVRKKINCS
jgi:Fe-Mn family superoxide dismutase